MRARVVLYGHSWGATEVVAIAQILGNLQFEYKKGQVNCDGFPWYARLFMKPHIEIESDPRVWDRVESLIRSELMSR